MKTAYLSSFLTRSGGGVSSSLKSLSKSLYKLGEETKSFGLADEFWDRDIQTWETPCLALPVSGPLGFGYSPGLSRELFSWSGDLLHLHGLWMYPSILANQWSTKICRPLLISPHGMLDPWALNHSGWKKKLALNLYEGKNLKQCTCFHALCRSEYESIRALGYHQPIAIIPNGVDLPDLIQKKLIPEDSMRTLLYVGRTHKKKNLLALLKAWIELPKNLTENWRLRIVGWGDNAYKKKLSVLGGTNVALDDSLYGPEKDKALRGASGFILPSFSEGLPMAILEAWSYGLPVLMSKECNIPEGFNAGAALETGTAQDQIARALERFLKISDSERQEIGEKGRKLVEEYFYWPMVASKMINVYQWLLGKGKRPECVVTD